MSNFEKLTYSCRIINRFLRTIGLEHGTHFGHFYSSFDTLSAHYSGIRIYLSHQIMLTVHTHPNIVGSAFASTCLTGETDKKLLQVFGYLENNCQFHETPEQLFNHLATLTGNYITLGLT